jgi:hypothetical protein
MFTHSEPAASWPVHRVGVDAARQRNAEESRKTMEIKVMHTLETILAEISRSRRPE